MFENLKKAINSHYDGAERDFSAKLEGLTVGAALESWYYRARMTAAALKVAQEMEKGEALPESVKAKMRGRFHRENERLRPLCAHCFRVAVRRVDRWRLGSIIPIH